MQQPSAETSLELTPGTAVGKYEVLRKLATGGMAEIYLARVRGTAGFEKIVVLKRILPNIAREPAFMQMFLDEAKLAATLQHPNIADVYDFGEADGAPFFTMEFIHGQDVRSIRLTCRKRGEPVPLAIALAIIHGTAAALDYAHDKRAPDGTPLGLVHRDISASNVLVSYDGAIKLVDFGIARATGRAHKTQVGTLKGKVPYMSPEQCRGWPLDRRSDLFSLGTLLFELTVGKRPYRGESDFTIMDQIVNQPAPRPTAMVQGYPGELEDIVLKLLAREPDHRYQTVEELLHDLDPFMAANKLWVSSKPLGKFMRTVFADRITAWEKAQQEGRSFSEHLATMVTSPSQASAASEMVTPPSLFPAMPLSQEMPAVRPTPISGIEIPASVATAKTAVLVDYAPPGAIEDTPPIRNNRMIYAAAAGVAILGAIVLVLALNRGGDQTAIAEPVSDTPVAPARPSQPATVKRDQPGPTPIARAVPAAQPPAVPAPVEPTKPVVTKPITKQVVGRRPEIKPADKKPDPKPADKKPDPSPSSKEQPWDPDSPTLPDD